MIKVYRDTTSKKSLDPKKSRKRVEAYKKDFSLWGDDFERFPEKMFFIYKEYLKKVDHESFVLFDVGAAEGIYSCIVPEFKTDFSVVCFEPETERLEVLLENLENKDILGDFEIYQKIVSNETSDLCYLKEWTEANDSGIGAGSATIIDTEDTNPKRRATLVPYQSVKLDDFIDQFPNVDALKIDVEGAEIKVLEGAKGFIQRFKPVIFLELHTSARFNSCTLGQVKEVIKETGVKYSFKLINKHGGELEYYIITPKKEK
tara:strand:- start:1307 stop:2086 length:780 start_codon:yes stop_codon:yes gene_type:complete